VRDTCSSEGTKQARNITRKAWKCDSSSRAPALQAQSPEFKSQYCAAKKKKVKEFKNKIFSVEKERLFKRVR
jgi:hypothetical protein